MIGNCDWLVCYQHSLCFVFSISLLVGFLESSTNLMFCRQQWSPLVPTGFPHTSTDREAYLSRRTDVLQFKFIDPAVVNFPITAKPHENLCLDKDNIIFSEVVYLPFLQIPVIQLKVIVLTDSSFLVKCYSNL